MEQKIITAKKNYRQLDEWLLGTKHPLLVCDPASIRFQPTFYTHIHTIHDLDWAEFRDFQPNPSYESVEKGVKLFREEKCDAILAVGGGSAIDVAKCIKLFARMEPGVCYLDQEIVPNDIPFLVMPTTAGTGSESTRYAVIYKDGVKQSVTHESAIPGTVLFDPDCLRSLPAYQKKATMMDALSHALESFWSVNSTEESRRFSGNAIELILRNMDGYLANTDDGNAGMLLAANTAGKAINITQTTAGHAMCYKITSLFHCAHGHAAALCDRILFPWMLENTNLCIDPRGEDFLKDIFQQIAGTMGCATPKEAADKLNAIFAKLGFEIPSATEEQFAVLRSSVNPVRLKNHPVKLDLKTIDSLYRQILR
jgi:alcohol dehydrogenase class IV